MRLRKTSYATAVFALTLMLTGLLHALADNHVVTAPEDGLSRQLSFHSLDDDLEDRLFRAAPVSVKKYQRKSQPTPGSDTTSPSVYSHFYDHGTKAKSCSLPLPWFIAHFSHSAHRLSGWKDSNLLYKIQAIRHA